MTSPKEKNGKKENVIEFAPLHLPLSRRLETLAVLIWFFPFFTFPAFGIFLLIYVYFYTSYWYLTVLYLTWYLYDRNGHQEGGHRINFIRRLRVWKRFANYFPIRLVRTAELDPSKNYLMAFHPHGIISLGDILNFGTEATDVSNVFPGIKITWLTLKQNFLFPLYREYVMALGGCSVTKESILNLLSYRSGGHGAIVVPGGAREALYSQPNSQVVYVKNRKGFVKLAIITGAQLVPVYAFGETDVYQQVKNPEGSFLLKFQKWYLAVTGIAPVLPFGRGIFQYTFGFLPMRRPITTVVGAPIPVEQNFNPTQEDIDKLHDQYIESLKKLYYDNRQKYGYPDTDITIM